MRIAPGFVRGHRLRAPQHRHRRCSRSAGHDDLAVGGCRCVHRASHRLGLASRQPVPLRRLVVDGVPTGYLLHSVNGITDGGSIAMINSETLGSVSLLPGSYPQRTGRRLGAGVDLATREGQRDKFHGRAGLSGTSLTFLGEGPIARKGCGWHWFGAAISTI